MKSVIAIVVLLAALVGCGANTEATIGKLLASGKEYFDQGRYREAAIMYSRAVRQDRRNGEAYFRLAQAELASGRVVEAVRAFHRAVELQPENAEAFSDLCEIYLSALEHDPLNTNRYLLEIHDLLTRAEQNNTDPFQVARIQGHVALLENHPEKAIEDFQRALSIDPASHETLLSLVRALTLAGQLDEAEKVALREIANDPTFAEMYDRLYLIYVQQGNDDEAGKLVLEKAAANPDQPEVLLQVAAHYHRVGANEKRDEVIRQLVAKAGGNAPLLSRIGDLYGRINNSDAAIRMYQQAAKTVPDDAAHKNEAIYYRLRVAETMASEGRGSEALQVVDEILAADAENPYAMALQGAIRLHGGDPAQVTTAISELEEVIAKMPNNAVLRYNLGLAYLSINDVDKATVQFQEAAADLPDYQAPRYQLGRIYLAAGQPAMALQLANEVLKINAQSVRGRLLKANAAIRMQELNQARESVESVLKEFPANPDAQFILASLNVAERRWDEAERILRRLHDSSPGDSRGVQGLISLYLAQGRPEKAQQMLDDELKKHPESRPLRLASAGVAMRAENYERAIADYNSVLETDPKQTNVQTAVALAYYYYKDWDRAEQHLRTARQLQPDNWNATLRLSMLLGERGDYQEASDLLNEVLKKAPENPVALNNMAYILADSASTLDQALELARKAVSRAPRNPNVAETLGWIYIKKNLYDQAIPIYEDIVTRYPDNPEWRYRYAMALVQKGDRVQARRELQEALARRPAADTEKRIRDLLTQVGS